MSLTRKITRQSLPKRRRTSDFVGMSELRQKPVPHVKFDPAAYVSPYAHRPGETPLDAFARGVGYSGPEMPDKGQRDGSCNRTACQLPLKDQAQWTMPNYGRSGGTDGKLYYCTACAEKFHEADREFGQPLRCTLEG